MASTYTTNLKIQEIGNGEQVGTWGTTTNTNWELIEQAVAGVATITMANADYTLTNLNGVSDEARNMMLVVTGTNSGIKKIIAPQNQTKMYIVSNQTTGGYAITIGAPTGSYVTVPNGTTAQVYTDGTNFYSAQTSSAGNFNVSGNLTVNGTIAGNLNGGAANKLVYQTAPNVTNFLSAPTVAGTGVVYDGTNIGWGVVGGAVASGCIYENNTTVSENYTMSTGKNGFSVGPISIASGYSVTVPSGQRWLIM